MAKRERKLSEMPFSVGEPTEVLVVELAYEEGGANWFHGGTSPRGYFVRVRPEKHENGMRSFTLGEGSKALIEPAKRFSDKRLDALAATWDPKALDDGNAVAQFATVEKMVAKVTAERVERNERNAQRKREYEARKAAEVKA